MYVKQKQQVTRETSVCLQLSIPPSLTMVGWTPAVTHGSLCSPHAPDPMHNHVWRHRRPRSWRGSGSCREKTTMVVKARKNCQFVPFMAGPFLLSLIPEPVPCLRFADFDKQMNEWIYIWILHICSPQTPHETSFFSLKYILSVYGNTRAEKVTAFYSGSRENKTSLWK